MVFAESCNRAQAEQRRRRGEKRSERCNKVSTHPSTPSFRSCRLEMRAIFLDIDGVICCNQFGRLEDRKLQLLRNVVQQTGAKIVLSTDWRRVPKLKSQLISTLRDYGMDVIGSTPMRAPWQPVRPQEITDWLASYNNAASMGNGEPIHSFVAVDDRSLLQESGGDGLRGEPPPAPPIWHALRRLLRRHPASPAPAPAPMVD